MSFVLILSLLSLGFFGGITHCVGMCGPFVLTQVTNRLQNISVDDMVGLAKLQNLALFPYHFGRIVTYSFLGFLSSLLAGNIADFSGFKNVAAVFLLVAAVFFLQNAYEFRIWPVKWRFLPRVRLDLRVLDGLFRDPLGKKGFLLGLVLGFIPCGLLYGALAAVAAISSPVLAGFAMFLFGLATMPALIFSGFGGYFFLKIAKKQLKLLSRVVILINSVTLIIMAFALLNK